MTTISKTTFTFVVLHRTDEPFIGLDNDDSPYDGTLGEALARSWDGNAVGAVLKEETDEVLDRDVERWLIELGNDGEFFDSDLAEDEDD